VILVAGRVYSPPYTVSAIGPEQEMRAALDAAPVVRAYRERASRLGLAWSVDGHESLSLPAYPPDSTRLHYARAADQSLEGSPP
jgi:uncharacterized protein YlxW (UPF0749 family)